MQERPVGSKLTMEVFNPLTQKTGSRFEKIHGLYKSRLSCKLKISNVCEETSTTHPFLKLTHVSNKGQLKRLLLLYKRIIKPYLSL